MENPKYKLGDLVGTYIDSDKPRMEQVLIGWIIKVEEMPLDEREDYTDCWRYDIQWADDIVEEGLSESTVACVIAVYRKAKRYNRWEQTHGLYRR